jgi:hypothetical protein
MSGFTRASSALTPSETLKLLEGSEGADAGHEHHEIDDWRLHAISPDTLTSFGLTKYGLTLDDCARGGVFAATNATRGSTDSPFLCYRLLPRSGATFALQIRYDSEAQTNRSKYRTLSRDSEELKGGIPLAFSTEEDNSDDDPIILVEDMLSAIKVSRHYECWCLLGSHLHDECIRRLVEAARPVLIWLDYDKMGSALKFVTRLQIYGLTAGSIITVEDPKEYSNAEIISYVEGVR